MRRLRRYATRSGKSTFNFVLKKISGKFVEAALAGEVRCARSWLRRQRALAVDERHLRLSGSDVNMAANCCSMALYDRLCRRARREFAQVEGRLEPRAR